MKIGRQALCSEREGRIFLKNRGQGSPFTQDFTRRIQTAATRDQLSFILAQVVSEGTLLNQKCDSSGDGIEDFKI